MASLSGVRAELGAALATIEGVRVSIAPPAQVHAPHAVVLSASVDYDATVGRRHVSVWEVRVLASKAGTTSGGLEVLDGLVDPATGVKAAVDGYESSVWDNATVISGSVAGVQEWGGAEYLAAVFSVRVIARH